MIFTEKIKKPVAMTLAAAVCTMLMAGSASAMVDTGAATVYKAADAASLKQHVQALSEDIGVRLMGTPNEYEAAQYVEDELDSYGYDAQILEWQIPENKSSTVAAIDVDGKEYYANYYFDGEMSAITDPAISDCTGKVTSADDLDIIDSWKIEKNSVAVVNYSLFTQLADEFNKKVEADEEAAKEQGIEYNGPESTTAYEYVLQASEKANDSGAKAMVVYADSTIGSLNIWDANWNSLAGNEIPVIAANTILGEYILNGEAGEISTLERPISWNVEAVKEASSDEPDSIIYVTSHMDSVMGAPGATDNASAVAAVLELAKQYKDVDTGGVELHFIAFGGEEAGLLGSKAFVSQIPEEDADISINFNMDMLSSPSTFDGQELNAVSLDIAPSSDESAVFNIAAALIITGSEDMTFIDGTDNLRWYQYGSSDHQPFQDNGIDAASMIRVTDKTDDIEDINHTYKDNMIDNYSLDRHVECTNMVSHGIAKAIDDKLTKVVEYYKTEDGNKIVAADPEGLSYLYDEIVYVFEKADGTTTQTTGYKSNDYAVIAPEGATLVSANGVGTGTANVAGTFDKPVTEQYSTSMVVKEVAAPAADEGTGTTLVDEETNVEITFTDAIAEGSELVITPVNVADKGYENIDNLLAVIDISVYNSGEIVPISDNLMEIHIPLSKEMQGYKYYQVAYLENGQIKEKIDATLEGNTLVFVTDHLSEYALLGSNTSFNDENPAEQTGTDTDNKANVTSNIVASNSNDTASNSNDTDTPVTGDETDIFAFVILMIAAGTAMTVSVIKKKTK